MSEWPPAPCSFLVPEAERTSRDVEPLRLFGSGELGICKVLHSIRPVPGTPFGLTLPSLGAPSDTLLFSFTLPARLFLSIWSPESLELDAAVEAGSPQSGPLALGVFARSALPSFRDASGEVWTSVEVSCPK